MLHGIFEDAIIQICIQLIFINGQFEGLSGEDLSNRKWKFQTVDLSVIRILNGQRFLFSTLIRNLPDFLYRKKRLGVKVEDFGRTVCRRKFQDVGLVPLKHFLSRNFMGVASFK